MKYLRLFVILLVFNVFGALNAQNTIKFLEMEYDFGSVIEGELATHLFYFENQGSDSLKLSSVQPSCGCTSPNWPRQAFMEGETGEIKVTYNSQGRLGQFYKSIQVTSNGSEQPLNLIIKGVVLSKDQLPTDSALALVKEIKPNLVFEKTEINFGKTERSKSLNKELKVTNTSKSTITIKNSASGCSCAYATNNLEIKPGQSQLLKISYSPKGEGNTIDKLVLISDEVDNPVYQLVFKSEVVQSLSLPKTILENGNDAGFGF